MNDTQKKEIIALLWDSLKTDPEHKFERKLTGWGTKTQAGLIACIERIFENDNIPAKQ